MRILYLTDAIGELDLTPSGAVTRALARMAQREGHHVHLLGMNAAGLPSRISEDGPGRPGGSRTIDGMPVSSLPQQMTTAAAERWRRWLRRAHFDAVHAVLPRPVPGIEWASDTGLPLVVTLTGLPGLDGDEPGGVADRMRRLGVLRSAAHTVVPSNFAAHHWQDSVPDCDFRVLPHGVDLIGLVTASRERQRDECAGVSMTLGCAHDGSAVSGVRELLNAFAEVPRPDVRLRLIGPVGGDASDDGGLAALAAADPRVRITPHGPGQTLVPLAGLFDLGCLPSLEPLAFARPVHECALLGRPCLVTDLGAQAEAVERYGCGERLSSVDRGAWTEAIERWAGEFEQGRHWGRSALGPVPLRIEEEAFYYDALLRSAGVTSPS